VIPGLSPGGGGFSGSSSATSATGSIGFGGFNFSPKGGSALPAVAWIALAVVAAVVLLAWMRR